VSWSIDYTAADITLEYRSKGTLGWSGFGWAVVGQTTRRMCGSEAIIVWAGQDAPGVYTVSCDGRGSNATCISPSSHHYCTVY
jgi:hypothetical protein